MDEDRNSPKAVVALKDFVQPQCDPSPSTWKYPHPRVEDKSSRHDSKAGALPSVAIPTLCPSSVTFLLDFHLYLRLEGRVMDGCPSGSNTGDSFFFL